MKTAKEWQEWCLVHYDDIAPSDFLIQAIQDDATATLRTQLKSVEAERDEANAGAAVMGREVADISMWIERQLQDLKYKDTSTTTATGFVNINGFAYSEIPDWEMRQKLDECKEALSTSAGKAYQARMEEAEWLVENACENRSAVSGWIRRRDAFLNPKPQDVK